MRICIVGAGAIGGLLAARLARTGAQVSVVARGAHLEAIRTKGLHYRSPTTSFEVTVEASESPAQLGTQDFVILTLKAPSLPGIAPQLSPLFGPDTTVVTAMNGIPWWFCDALPKPLEGRQLVSVDPDGILAGAFPKGPSVGCVVHAGASVPEPGLVDHAAGEGFIFGGAQRGVSAQAAAMADLASQAGLSGTYTEDIHSEIWLKLIGNMGMGPISALTGATLAGIASDADARPIAAEMMSEAVDVGEALGLPMDMSVEARIDLGAELGEFKPSILQDLERGRPMEIDALVTVVCELGQIAGVPTPTIDTVLALLRGRARRAGLY
ncbi:MAG: 2-dehydropantoate 2-reductase [Alphaproteobacteria bacterium]|nr:2-dehydropantoate 2-reductase [Alphaproteobacteria bacterium]